MHACQRLYNGVSMASQTTPSTSTDSRGVERQGSRRIPTYRPPEQLLDAVGATKEDLGQGAKRCSMIADSALPPPALGSSSSEDPRGEESARCRAESAGQRSRERTTTTDEDHPQRKKTHCTPVDSRAGVSLKNEYASGGHASPAPWTPLLRRSAPRCRFGYFYSGTSPARWLLFRRRRECWHLFSCSRQDREHYSNRGIRAMRDDNDGTSQCPFAERRLPHHPRWSGFGCLIWALDYRIIPGD
jgi:hypothetical protein